MRAVRLDFILVGIDKIGLGVLVQQRDDLPQSVGADFIVVIEQGDTRLTYGELETRTQQVARLVSERGAPRYLRSDNGPEFRALDLPEGVEAAFFQPDSPWLSGHVESFFDKLRDELLNQEVFPSGAELQAHLDEHLDFYNHLRPHRRLRGLPPASFRDRNSCKMQEAETLKL